MASDIVLQEAPNQVRQPYQPQAKAIVAPATINRKVEPKKERLNDEQFGGKLDDIGTLLRKNVVSKRGGNEAGVQRVDKTYQDFRRQIAGQQKMMERATDEQKDVFRELTEEVIKLRNDENMDFDKAFKQFERVVHSVNSFDGPQDVKDYIEKIASTAMKNTDKMRAPTGLKGVAYASAQSFLTADKKTEESAMFKYLTGQDRPKDPKKMITALETAQNSGNAERLKKHLSEDITGEMTDSSPLSKLLEQMIGKPGAGANGGNGGSIDVKWPESIENLHVANLIIKSVTREGKEHGIGGHSSDSKGRSALALPAPAPKPVDGPNPLLLAGPAQDVGHKNAEVPPKVPETGLTDPILKTYRKPVQPKLTMDGHKGVQQRALKYDDIEYTDFKEVPSKKPEPKQIEHTQFPQLEAPKPAPAPKEPEAPKKPAITVKKSQWKLKTKETPMAQAVRGALNVMPTLVQPKPTLTSAIAPWTAPQLAKSDLPSNDVASVAVGEQTLADIDAAKTKEEDREAAEDAAAQAKPSSSIVDDLKSAADAIDLPEKGKGKGKAPKGKTPKVGKLDKAMKVGGKLMKGAAVAGAVVDVGMGVKDLIDGKPQEEMPSGLDMLSPMRWGMYAGDKINKGIESLTGGQSLGSKIYDWSHDDPKNAPTPMKPKGLPQEVQMRPNQTGNTLTQMNADNAAIKAAPPPQAAPVVIAPSGSGSAPATITNFMPVTGNTRSRESYFDRQQMNSFVK